MQTEENRYIILDATSILDAMKSGKTAHKNVLYKYSRHTIEGYTYQIFFDKDTYPVVKKYFKKKKSWSVHEVKCAQTSIRAHVSKIYTQQEGSKIALVTGRADAYRWVFTKILKNDTERAVVMSVIPPNE